MQRSAGQDLAQLAVQCAIAEQPRDRSEAFTYIQNYPAAASAHALTLPGIGLSANPARSASTEGSQGKLYTDGRRSVVRRGFNTFIKVHRTLCKRPCRRCYERWVDHPPPPPRGSQTKSELARSQRDGGEAGGGIIHYKDVHTSKETVIRAPFGALKEFPG